MRILMLAPGASIHSQRLIQRLIDVGHHVTLLDRQCPDIASDGTFSYVPFWNAWRLQQVRRVSNGLADRLRLWLLTRQIRSLARRMEADVINVQWVDDRAIAAASAGVRPFVLSCWGSDINSWFGPPQPWQTSSRQGVCSALAAADHVTADSQEVLNRCQALAGKRLATSLFYFGIDFGLFRDGYAADAARMRQGLGISPDAKVFLSIRAMRPTMGHHHVLEAFADASKDGAFDGAVLVFKRYLAHTTDQYERDILERSRQLSIDRRVFWMDSVPYDQMPVQYAMSDFVINYPEADGFPVSFFEAAACRRTIITADLEAYKGPFDAALVKVAPNNATALAQTMLSCLHETADVQTRRISRAADVAKALGDERESLKVLLQAFSGRPPRQASQGG